MKYESQNELIGAYLDGELSPSEQIRVEQLLDDQPECRQLYDELRALRHGFQNLPRYRVGEDLAPKVLRIAEREMLLGGRGAATANGRQPVSLPNDLADDELHARSAWRTWLWPSVAVAAALALLVINLTSKRTVNENVAQSDPTQTKQGTLDPTTPDKLQRSQPDGNSAIAKAPFDPVKPNETQPTNDRTAPTVVAGNDSTKPLPNATGDPAGTSAIASANGVAPKENPPADSNVSPKPVGSFAQGVMIVKCDLRPEAVENGSFGKLLTEAQIAWHNGDAVETAPADGETLALGLPETALYVEATTRQVRDVLFQLLDRSEEFAGLETRPQPGVSAERLFLVYNRANPASLDTAPATAVAKANSIEAVNARTVPDPPKKTDKLGFDVGSDSTAPKPDAGTNTTKKPGEKKPAVRTAKTPPADGQAEDSLASHDDEPVRVLFLLRKVDAAGKPIASYRD